MRIAIMQPGYLPWLGFFELMHNCDQFILLDDVQYTNKDWRNRNRIRCKHGWFWLSVPVLTKNKRFQLISESKINPSINWRNKHLHAIEINYHKARYFNQYFPSLEEIINRRWDYLIDLNSALINWLVLELKINKTIIRASVLNTGGECEDKIIAICNKLGADELYDSKAASSFLDINKFHNQGINIIFQDFHHPIYKQIYQPFISHMSIVDLLFNHGPDSLGIILGNSNIKSHIKCT